MRLVIRVLGADVFEISTEAEESGDDAPAQRGIAGSADTSTAPVPFGFGAASPNDEPMVTRRD